MPILMQQIGPKMSCLTLKASKGWDRLHFRGVSCLLLLWLGSTTTIGATSPWTERYSPRLATNTIDFEPISQDFCLRILKFPRGGGSDDSDEYDADDEYEEEEEDDDSDTNAIDRQRRNTGPYDHRLNRPPPGRRGPPPKRKRNKISVSYTHLTLPTKA